jgi:putative membrane protein
MRQLIPIMVCGLLAATTAFAQTPPAAPGGAKMEMSSAAMSAQGFLSEAAHGNLAEVELGKLAASHASSPDVKAFGQKMVTDHGKTLVEIKALAAQKSVTLPAKIDAKHQAEQDKLAVLSGTAFDRAYVQAMVADHQKDVAEFKHQASMNADNDVKAWAAKTLPTLEEHLQMVQTLQQRVAAN